MRTMLTKWRISIQIEIFKQKQIEIWELKTITEIKISLDGLKSRMKWQKKILEISKTKEIRELKDKSIENIQSEKQKEK